MGNNSVFFYFDLDAFFASVEQMDNPQYRGKPVIIGKPVPRSVVSTCSYEARKYGIHSAMPALTAYKLCPNGIFLDGNMKRYCQVSRQVMSLLSSYSDVHQISIDEAWLDMTGTGLLFGPPKELAIKIKQRIKDEIGITASVGIARSPFIAKMASDYRKPDGLCIVSPGKEQLFIDAVGLENIWGVGKSSYQSLLRNGLTDTESVRKLTNEELNSKFGNSMGNYLFKAVRGIDPGTYEEQSKSHSISTETTFIENVTDEESLKLVLLQMSRELMFRSFDENIIAKTVGLKIRWGDFKTITVQTTPDSPILNTDNVYSIAVKLLKSKWKEGQGIRLLGLGLYQTYKGDNPVQEDLFMSDKEKNKRELEKIIHKLTENGTEVFKATQLK